MAETARLELTTYFLGADVLVTAQSLAFEPHKETPVLCVPALEKQMSITGTALAGNTIKARGGEQVLMAMLEETAAAKALQIVVAEGEKALGAFDALGLAGIMPDMRACFDGL